MPFVTTTSSKVPAQIFYKDWGTKTAGGRAMFFSHGWPLNSDDWEAQMVFFSNRGYRCIAYDRRGHGQSEQTWEGNDVDTWADDINDVIRACGDIGELTLVGHSTGGADLVRYMTKCECR
jgi:non-heme chloroperoxidase